MARFIRVSFLGLILPAIVLASLSAKKVQPMELDFAAQLKQCKCIPYSESRNSVVNADSVLTEPTDCEKEFLSQHLCADGNAIGINHTIIRAIRFHALRGKLPANGWELLSLYQTSLATPEGKERFLGLSSKDQFETARWAVNPVTGKLFDSFTSAAWTPLGISLTQLTGPDSIRNLDQILPGRPGKPSKIWRGWRVIVYGEKENTRLIDKVVWFQDR